MNENAKIISMLEIVVQGIARLEERVAGLEKEVAEVKEDLRHTKILIENETNKHIRMLAEGHDMVYKKQVSLQPIVEKHEEDISVIKAVVSTHSAEIKRLKEAI